MMIIIIRSCKIPVLVTGECRNVADSLAARLCCSCTVGTELVGWVGTYEYAERRTTVVSFVSPLGSHCALINKPVFSRFLFAQCIISVYCSMHCCSVHRAHLVSWSCDLATVKCALRTFRVFFVILKILKRVKNQFWFDPYFCPRKWPCCLVDTCLGIFCSCI